MSNGTASVVDAVGVAATSETATKPKPTPPARPATSRLRSTVALTNGPAQPVAETEAAPVVATPAKPDIPFTLDQVQDLWVTFAKLRQQQNDSATEQLVLNRELTLNGTTLHLTLDNTLQVNYLTELKPDLMMYLRTELQNSQVQLEHTVNQQEVKKMIYSSQDKYNFLADKNPALHELRKVLNLEVDY